MWHPQSQEELYPGSQHGEKENQSRVVEALERTEGEMLGDTQQGGCPIHPQVCEAWRHSVCRNIWSWEQSSET